MYTEHSNRRLDLTVEDAGLAKAIELLARLDDVPDTEGKSAFDRTRDRMCLAWKLSSDNDAAYVAAVFETPDPEFDEPGWNKIPNGIQAEKIAEEIRKALTHIKQPRSNCETTAPGWRLMEPMAAALEYENEPEDFESAFTYIEKYTCEFEK